MSDIHLISPTPLNLSEIEEILRSGKQLRLSQESISRIEKCRTYIDRKIQETAAPIYGVNTGFGSLCDTLIDSNQLEQLQVNLVMSHACGTGEEVPAEIVKIMLLLKVIGLSYGNSGVQLQTVQRLIDFYNHDVIPLVYQQGSLGASGDLAPLAHLSLPLIGMGEVYYKGKRQQSSVMLQEMSWNPIPLKSKEGLALLNGTQFMSAYGIWCLMQAKQCIHLSDLIACLSLDAFLCRMDPFNTLIQTIRPHKGQIETAEFVRSTLAESELQKEPKKQVQDPYSFRCIPQVHGATKDTYRHVESVLLTEVNSVTDNPTLFPDEDLVISAGNFHGQPLALALDFLAIALSELGNISERRTYQLISGARGLPPFLVASPGLNSGLMIPQYTAASIVSQNKQLCTPSSVDSIVSSNGQEDHVSMGSNSATKLKRVVDNVYKIIAIELLNAAQALEFRKPGKTSVQLETFVASYRKVVPFIEKDRVLYTDIDESIRFLRRYHE